MNSFKLFLIHFSFFTNPSIIKKRSFLKHHLNSSNNHKKYGKTFLKWTLLVDSGTVLNILNSVSQFSLTYMIDAKLLHL